jgi:hypothetical protein
VTITQQRVTCAKCKRVGDVEIVTNAPLDVVAASMKAARCPHCGSDKIGLGGGYSDSPPLSAPVAARAAWWRERGEVGISSETIYSAFSGSLPRMTNYPLDPDDFRRCNLLLGLIPEWRADLGKVADRYPWFKPFTDAWDQMDALYAEEAPKGTCPKLYALMKRLEVKAELIRRGSE